MISLLSVNYKIFPEILTSLIVAIAFSELFATYTYGQFFLQFSKFNIFECDFSLNYNNQGELLEKLRGRIDELDAELLALLNERAKCVMKIGAIKQKENTEVLVPQREIELLDRLISLNQGPMTADMVLHIFQQIIDTLKELQK